MRRGWRPSLRLRLLLCLLGAGAIALGLHLGLTRHPGPMLLGLLGRTAPTVGSVDAWLITGALMLPVAALMTGWLLAPLTRLLRALEGTVLSYRDGEFGSTIAAEAPGGLAELDSLTRLHSELGLALREQRHHLAQRELLLDTVVQNTPVALVLTDAQGRIAYANIAARQLLDQGRGLAGRALAEVLQRAPEPLRDALLGARDGLFATVMHGEEEQFHLSLRDFRLQGQPHRLRLLRRMTRELSRQEVASWKRVIRVISHELNNSLAPISSLAHSGAELARRGQVERLPGVFGSIGERAAHLHAFLSGYAQFAKLPAPTLEKVDWREFVDHLEAHCRFRLEGELPTQAARIDAAQMAQALINLLKNAHEAGGAADEVCVSIATVREDWRIDVTDRGPGMTEAQLSQALLPFYSTKRSGTGLGLALAREIAEAHGGRIALRNRDGGGLTVSISWPRGEAETSSR